MGLDSMTKEDLISLFKEAISEYAEFHPLSSEEVQ
jgi:hypothetical protein